MWIESSWDFYYVDEMGIEINVKENYYPSPSFEHAHTWFTIDRQTGQTETENEKSSYGRITSTTATQYTFPHTNTHP